MLLDTAPAMAAPGAATIDECPPLVHAMASGDADCLLLLVRAGVDVAGLLGGHAEEAIGRLHGAEVGAEVARRLAEA